MTKNYLYTSQYASNNFLRPLIHMWRGIGVWATLNQPVLRLLSIIIYGGNPAVKIEGGGGQRLYLYIVKIGNFTRVLMPFLTIL